MNDVSGTTFADGAQPISDSERSAKFVALFKSAAAPYIIAPETDMTSSLRLVFDIEADGLLDVATKVHCIAIVNLDQDEVSVYGPAEIDAALAHLRRADYLVGHNDVGYDIPLLQQLYGWTPPPGCRIVDTLVCSRLILPDIGALDDRAGAASRQKLGKKLRGSHSLEAWGLRLGIAKTGTDIEVWSEWTPEMQERCIGDARLTKALWHFLRPDGYSQRAIDLEHRTTIVCDRIKTDGVPFDVAAANRLEQQLTARRSALEAELSRQFPRVKLTSRPQIGAALEARGWVPEERTKKTNQPRVTNEVLETISEAYPEFTGLSEYMILGRLIAALSTGEQSWLKHVRDDHIHSNIVPTGTPHSRAKHFGPNIAQVPNPKKGKPYGTECRALFRSGNGWVFVSADQASLQDRGFAHYLHPHDDGAYSKSFTNGVDAHWQTATALGLVTEGTERAKDSKLHTMLREGAKTFRYAFLYGAQNKRAGWIIYNAARSVLQLDSGSLRQKFFGNANCPAESMLQRVGGKARNAFIESTPGLRDLKQKLENHAIRYGWLPGLDGRRVPVRAKYTVLNYIVTSSEAVICKLWLVRVYDELCARGDKPRPHEDIANWLDPKDRGGDPAKLLDICRKIPAEAIIAAPYQFRDEADIPQWDWLYGWHLLRGEVAGTAALTDIDNGMDNGQRYSNDNAATKRAAFAVVQKHCPNKTRTECRRIITAWIKQGLLYADEYDDPVERKPRTGLFVRKTRSEI
jgi:DNA polymerase I-like protein with 3'-5' exonuclease and polymerase domains